MMARRIDHGRKGDWITTAGGRPFWPLDPRPEDVHWDDVAHHLAQRNRFTGACRRPYTVAQHSVIGALVMDEQLLPLVEAGQLTPGGAADLCLAFLLHDTDEAYGPDIARPVKREPAMAPLVAIMETIRRVVFIAANLDPDLAEAAAVKKLDRRLLRTEQRDLMPPAILDEDRTDVPCLDEVIQAWEFDMAKELWLAHYHYLQGRRPRMEVAGRC